MLKKLIATAAVLTVVAAANATITASYDLYQSGTLTTGDAYSAYRIYVDVSNDDDWTAAGLDLTLTGGTFYQNAFGGNPPNPGFFPAFPDVEWDSYYTSPATYPNTTYDAAAVGVASTADTSTVLNTDWFDTASTGDGHWAIAQFTVLNPEAVWSAEGMLQYAAADTGGELFELPISIYVPEPASLALLGLGALALVRRR